MNEVLEAKWYVLHVYAGYEQMVKDSLERLIENNNLGEYIKEVVVPMEETIEEKNGKRKIVSRKLIPSYVFIKIAYTNDLWFAITSTRGVTGFVGPNGRPLPLTDEEVKRMHLEKAQKMTVSEIDVKVGDSVKVIEGAIEGFVGVITEINGDKLRATVNMFNRETVVDLEPHQIQVIEK